MTMEYPPFEDVFSIDNEIFQCHFSFDHSRFWAGSHIDDDTHSSWIHNESQQSDQDG